MKTQNSLLSALQLFEEDWLMDLGVDGCKESLKRQLKDNLIDIKSLKMELKNCVADSTYNWKKLASKASIFSDVELYEDWQIKTIVEYYLDDIVNPEILLDDEEKGEISIRVMKLLTDKKGWLSVKELLNLLNQTSNRIKAYHLFNYKQYLELDLDVLRLNANLLWVIDALRIKD